MAKFGKLQFERLPKKMHQEVIDLFEDDMKKKLLEIHNKYKLTTFDYNKCCDLSGMMIHFQTAITEGIIGK